MKRSREKRRSELARRRIEAHQTVEKLEQSLESTVKGLQLLLRSLEASGFKDAVRPYREMALVLMYQRAWAQRTALSSLEPYWKKISETAFRIREILYPFAQVMGSLATLEGPGASGAAKDTSETSAENRELELLLARLLRRFTVSHMNLERLAKEDFTGGLLHLQQGGLLEPRGWGKGKTFGLREEVVQDLARWLAGRLAPLPAG